MTCPRCEQPVVVIRMAFGGADAAMRSCRSCDTRSWDLDGLSVGLDEVLDAVPTRRRAA